VDQVTQGQVTVSRNIEATVNARIAQIDRIISRQLDEILHHAEFQKLEATWRGLKFLLDQSETGTGLRIKVLQLSKKELSRDMEKSQGQNFDQSELFRRIYEDGIGVYGGHPFGAIVGDYEFTNHPEDISILKGVAGVAAAAHAPFLSAVGAQMFGLDTFDDLHTIRDIAKKMDTPDYAAWKGLRASEDSRYLGLTMPHILMRLPYGAKGVRVEAFDYEEGVDGTNHRKYLWGNAAYALATRLTASFADCGWCTTIRGPVGGGRVDGLPVHTFRTADGDLAMKCPAEVQIVDRREKELADAGFIPFVHCKETDYGAFFSVQSVQQPIEYQTPDATANARLSAQLPYIFAVSRFAHYVKSMMRDNIGSYKSRGDTERYLKEWINNYITEDDNASPAIKAEKPLREANIEVVDIPGRPGSYRAVMHLRPHYQLDELKVSLRLVAELPEAKK
jgi:type VI secretion system protein ImpC